MFSRAWVQITAATLSGNSLRQTVYTHRASVHKAKLVATLLRVVGITAGLVEIMAAYCQVYDSSHLQGWGVTAGLAEIMVAYCRVYDGK